MKKEPTTLFYRVSDVEVWPVAINSSSHATGAIFDLPSNASKIYV